MTQSLSSEEEQKLLAGVRSAVDLIDGKGMTPNEALHKVAKDMKFTPGFLRAACNALNNGRQLSQWRDNDSALDKLAAFPLADYDTIHDSLWGNSREKAAVDYGSPQFLSYQDQQRQALLEADLPGSLTKQASALPDLSPEAERYHLQNLAKKATDDLNRAKRAYEEARRQKTACEDRLNLSTHLLRDYFRKYAYDRLPLAQVEYAATTYYGKPGRALMDYVASSCPGEKRAADHKPGWKGFCQPMARNQPPYQYIELCIKNAKDLHLADDAIKDAENRLLEAQRKLAEFLPRPPAPSRDPMSILPEKQADRPLSKTANILGGLAGGLGAGVVRDAIASASTTMKEKVQDQLEELNNAKHLAELRKIRAQTLLTQMMSDPADPLHSHDPDEVLSAYNELVQLSPRLADQPAAIGPLLRKRLVGNTEPFELVDQLKMEEGLKKVQSPTIAKDEGSIL